MRLIAPFFRGEVVSLRLGEFFNSIEGFRNLMHYVELFITECYGGIDA